MAVDFDALVLGPVFDAFARDVTLVDLDDNAMAARGIFASKPRIDDMGDGAFIAHVSTLGLRASELAAIPAEGWRVIMGSVTYDVPQPPQIDGEGRVEIILRRL